MTNGSLAKIYNIPMRNLGYSDFAIQTGKLDARLILSCLLFPYPAIIQNCTVQKYPAFFVLNRWLSLWFGVYLMWLSHFARAFHKLELFENTWPAHSTNFENGMETGLNIQSGKFLFHISYRQFNKVWSSIDFTYSHFIFQRNISTIKHV